MNSAQHFKVRMMADIYTAIKEISNEYYEELDNMTERDLMMGVMQKTKGHYNPAIVQKIIEEL